MFSVELLINIIMKNIVDVHLICENMVKFLTFIYLDPLAAEKQTGFKAPDKIIAQDALLFINNKRK